MENMPGTLSPEEMAKLQMFADALRAPGIQQSSFNPAQGGGMQTPQANPMGGFSSGMQLGKGLQPGVSNIGTALKYDTTPFSQQTNMLAAQDAGF